MAASQASAAEPQADEEDLDVEASEGKLVPYRSHQAMQQWTPSFALSVDQAVEQVNMKRDFMDRVMRKEEHYGAIPGTKKPTLFKAGAELLLSAMALHPTYGAAGPSEVDLGGRDHDGEAFVRHQRVCRIWRQTGPGEHDRMLVAEGEGSCNSWEAKYRWRESKRKCSKCQAEAIIKGKAEYGGGWVCFKTIGGCGAKFPVGDKSIEGQKLGREPNPDIADLDNTILKMANKRALVAATLNATGCSDLFTQDLEDMTPGVRGHTVDDREAPPPSEDEAPDPRDEQVSASSQSVPNADTPPTGNRYPEKPPCSKCKTNKFASQYKTPKDPAKPYFCKKDKGGCGDDYGPSEVIQAMAATMLTPEERESLTAKHSKLPPEFQWPEVERKALVADGFREALAKIERRQELAAIHLQLPTNYKPDERELAEALLTDHETAKGYLEGLLEESRSAGHAPAEEVDNDEAVRVLREQEAQQGLLDGNHS